MIGRLSCGRVGEGKVKSSLWSVDFFGGGYSGGYSEVDIHFDGNWIFKIWFWRGGVERG